MTSCGKLTPATQLPAFQSANEMMYSSQCFAQPGFRHLPIGAALDQFNCILTTTFQAAHASKPARAVADILGVFLIPTVVVMLYESFRPVHALTSIGGVLARGASFFLIIAQGVAGGLGIPLYFTAAALSTSSGGAAAHSRALSAPKPGAALIAAALPPPPAAWATLAAVFGGYILPSIPLYRGLQTGWTFDALSKWQIFPLYVLFLALLLPRVLPVIVPWTATEGSRAYAVIALALLGLIPSLAAQWRLVFGDVALADVFLLRPQGAQIMSTMGYGMHIVLLADLVAIVGATASYVLTADGGSGPDVRGRFVLFGLLSCVLGPAGALSVMWGYRELCLTFAYERIAYGDEARLEEDEGKIDVQ